MQGSRLLKIFKQLSKKELRDLDKFVGSPFHNQRTDVVLLFQYLKKVVPNDNPLHLKKTYIFSQIFPKDKYKEKKIRYTMSFLYQVIKDFLAIQEFQSNKISPQIAVVQSFRKKGIESLFEQEFKATTTLLEKSSLRNQDYFYQNYLIQNERYLFTTSQTRGVAKGLVESAEHLDQFFIIQKLRESARALSHQTVGAAAFQPTFLPDILAFLDQSKETSPPAVAIYYHCFKVLEATDSLPYFQNLRQLMRLHCNCFSARELQDIYSFALNYCIKQLNVREMAFGREAFELYKEGLQQEIFFENGILSRFNYKNIVALGLGLKEFDWVAQFIEQYKPYLNKKFQESAYHYNLALLHYRKENYDQAMELLQQVGTNDVLENLTARRMLVCIYYDQETFDALHSLLDSFQNYIYRKSGLNYQRRMYLNFIKFTRKLLQLEKLSTVEVRRLRKEILGTRNVAEKGWLLERVGGMN